MSSVVTAADDFLRDILTVEAERALGAHLLDHTNEAGLGEFEELCWQYLHKLPTSLKLGQIKTHIESDTGSYGGRRYEFDSRLFASDSAEPHAVGQLMVTLYRKPNGSDDDLFLELEQCQLWYPEMRGQGLGKAIIELVSQLGRALGVKALTAIAIYDGRFVWPSLGFQFGDYLPDQKASQRFQRRFTKFCQLHEQILPELENWDAPDFARFIAPLKLTVGVGHSMDRQQKSVEFGRAFLLTRRPFFLSLPL